jgi:ankyrin repeat protein
MTISKLFFNLTFLSIINAGNYSDYNYDSNPPIIVATIYGDLSKVKTYCTASTINTQNNNGQTALMHSCIHNSGDIFIFLIENNADFNIKDNSGKTALDYAIEQNRAQMIEFLLLSGADANLSLDEALKKAAEIQNIKNLTRNMLKEISCYNPNIIIIKSCISAGADINARDANGSSALLHAAQIRNTEIAKLLIAAGADVNSKNNDDRTALMFAAKYGHTEMVKLLIAAGADVNAKDNYGATALIYAALDRKTEIARLLIAAGADVNARDIYGNTALILADQYNYKDTARLLIDAGADSRDISPINLFELKHPNLYKAAVISAKTTVISTAAVIGYKLWQNFAK